MGEILVHRFPRIILIALLNSQTRYSLYALTLSLCHLLSHCRIRASSRPSFISSSPSASTSFSANGGYQQSLLSLLLPLFVRSNRYLSPHTSLIVLPLQAAVWHRALWLGTSIPSIDFMKSDHTLLSGCGPLLLRISSLRCRCHTTFIDTRRGLTARSNGWIGLLVVCTLIIIRSADHFLSIHP